MNFEQERIDMNIAVKSKSSFPSFEYEESRFERVEVTDERIIACFSDGRIVGIPLWWSWRLEQSTPEQRANYKIIGSGRTAYWPDIDEHLSVQGFLTGTPAPSLKQK